MMPERVCRLRDAKPHWKGTAKLLPAGHRGAAVYSGGSRYVGGEAPKIYDRVAALGAVHVVVGFSSTGESVWFDSGTGNCIKFCHFIHRGFEEPNEEV